MIPFFINKLTLTDLSQGMFCVDRPFGFVDSCGRVVLVEPGRFTNLASVPLLLRCIYRPYDKYRRAAVIHDELVDEQCALPEYRAHTVLPYGNAMVRQFVFEYPAMDRHIINEFLQVNKELLQRITPQDAAKIMRDAMRTPPYIVGPWRRMVVYLAVKWFGPQRWRHKERIITL